MSIFPDKKNASAAQKTAPKRDLVTMTCPYCQHEQPESRIAVSTYCRGCGSHYEMLHGKALALHTTSGNPFAAGKKDSKEKHHPIQQAEEKPAADDDHTTSRAHQANSEAKSTSEIRAQITRGITTASNLFHKKNQRRQIQCLECDHQHEAPAQASSTLCPACGAYISLKDHVINGHWNRRIKTRGNVTIQKKGVVTDVTIYCHNILVQGTLKGGIDCSGDVTLNSPSKIMGQLHCKRLIIQKKADVAFANEVHCEEAIIDGHVTGNFICSGKLHLKKKSVLNGNIVVARMTIDKGARHHGNISIKH